MDNEKPSRRGFCMIAELQAAGNEFLTTDQLQTQYTAYVISVKVQQECHMRLASGEKTTTTC